MDGGGVWKEGEKGRGAGLERGRDGVLVVVLDGRVWRRDDFWLLVLVLLLLRVGIVRIIIRMTIIIRVYDISYIVRSWGR